MAKILQAVSTYGPKLNLQSTVGLERVAEWAAMRTGMNRSEVMMSMQEFSEAILYFSKGGTPVKMPGVGIFTPSIDREGNISINFRPDMALKKGLKSLDEYHGGVTNRSNVGLDDARYKEMWDAEHPGDPLEV